MDSPPPPPSAYPAAPPPLPPGQAVIVSNPIAQAQWGQQPPPQQWGQQQPPPQQWGQQPGQQPQPWGQDISPAPMVVIVPGGAAPLPGATAIDHAFARSGRDLAIASAVFTFLTFALSIVACTGPWVNIAVRSGAGSFLPIQDCSLALGLIYYGYYGPACSPALTPKWGEKTIAQLCSGSSVTSFGVCTASTGQFSLAVLALCVILAAVACASSSVACGRFSRSPSAPVPALHFGTVTVMVALSATAFSLACLGTIVAVVWLGVLPPQSFDGGGKLAGEAAVGCGLIGMVLAIVLKFKTRGLGKMSTPEVFVARATPPPPTHTPPLTPTPHNFDLRAMQPWTDRKPAGQQRQQVLLLLSGLVLFFSFYKLFIV